MKRYILVITFLCTIPLLAVAGDTLYQCTKNGETTLQDRKPKDCDAVKKYTYESYANELEEPEGLRAREKRAIKALPPLPSSSQNESANGSFAQCHYYKSQIEDALHQFRFDRDDRKDISMYYLEDLGREGQRLVLKIKQAQAGMQHYCPPGTKIIDLTDQTHFKLP
ncbi:MAG: hypothetical protein U1E78_13235 [Gammaproteobacteria bacterium]